MSMSIEEVNKILPVKVMIETHMVDDDPMIIDLLKKVMKEHGMENVLDWLDPEEYHRYLMEHPGTLPHICIYDYRYKDDETGVVKDLDGLDLTRIIMKRAEDMDEAAKPKVILITAMRDPSLFMDFTNADGFRIVEKNWDSAVFKKDLMDAYNTAALRVKRVLERAAFFLNMDKKEQLYKLPIEKQEP